MTQSKMNRRKNFFYLLFIVILGSLVVVKSIHFDVDIKKFCFNIRNNILNFLTRELVYEKFIITSGKMFENRTIIYVLGGGQDSSATRFREASVLYHQGLSNKILILSKTGTTEFDFDLGRNLTNNEWSMRELEMYKVRKEDIEVVPIEVGFFGTANEAKCLSGIVVRRGINRLILVTSLFHTKRAFTAFSRFAADRHLELFIYGSEDSAELIVLLQEYMKLLLYENIILPAYGLAGL